MNEDNTAQRFAELLERLSHDMEAFEQREIRHSALAALSPVQIRYLDTVYHMGNPTVSELGRRVNSSKPTVTLTVEKLVEKGYLRKIRSDEDRRAAHVHLTAKGVSVAEEHEAIHHRYADGLAKRLSERELNQLIGLLAKGLPGSTAAEE